MGLSDIWHSLEDTTWSLADFLEDKGIPIATFCEERGISPLILFLGMIVAVVLLFAILGGAGGAAEDAVLIVTVSDEEGGAVVSVNVKVTYDDGETVPLKRTGYDGKVTFDEMRYTGATVSLDDNRYRGDVRVSISEKKQSVSLPAQTITGTLRIKVEDTAGSPIPTGSIDVKEVFSGDIVDTKQVTGASSYDFELPVGAYKAVVKSTSGGELASATKDVRGDAVTEQTFTVSADAADSAGVRVVVKDSNGNLLRGAYVVLWNVRNDAAIGEQLVTDASGSATFTDVAIGTSVYPTASKPDDKRYGQLDAYNGKNLYRRVVQSSMETIEVELPLNGRVEVLVYDKESQSPISGASVYIKGKSGEVLSETKRTDSDGKVSFAGFEENIEVYPVVTATGYLDQDNPGSARPVRYISPGVIKFSAAMERDASVILSVISIMATNVFGDRLRGVDAVLSETGGLFVRGLSKADNITFEIDNSKIYNLALHKPGYLRKVLEGVGPGSQTVELEDSNPANSGEVRICASIVINDEPSDATATVELFLGTGALIDIGDTIGEGDGDSCITFQDVPRGWSVYARATSDAYSPVETDLVDVIALQDGVTQINISFNALAPNAPVDGEVKVCVEDERGDAVGGAEVLLYDADLDGPSWEGSYRLATAADGCVIFSDIPSEKTDYEGVLSPVFVYAIVSATGYATYNGKSEGSTVQVQPQRITPLNVRLGAGQTICINVESEGSPVQGAYVSLCADAQCDRVLETRQSESDGHATFSSDITSVTAKAVVNQDSMVKEAVESFALADVTRGQCGTIEVEGVTQYATVSLDGIVESLLETEPGASSEIEFLVRINDELATGGATSLGGQNVVKGADGTQVVIALTGDPEISPGSVRTVDAGEGSYALPFIAPSEEGDYRVTLEAGVYDCETCQGDQRSLTVRVGDGDEDDDGVPDEYDSSQYMQQSVQVCVVDDRGSPIYDSSIIMYHSGTYGTGYESASGSQYGYGHSQSWQAVSSSDNCRVFVGHTPTSGFYLDSFLNSFQLTVSAKGYQEFDSRTADRDRIRLASGTGGMFAVEVVLTQDYLSEMGEGTIINPSRTVELLSESWKVQNEEKKNYVNLYPLVSKADDNVNLLVTYDIGGPAPDTMDYTIDYKISGGGGCYEVEAGADTTAGGRTVSLRKGQSVVEDELTVHTDEACWELNKVELEKGFHLVTEGRLLQIGDKEAEAEKFDPARVEVHPIVGATREIRGVGDLSELKGLMELAEGVATSGSLPYCIDEKKNTGSSAVVRGSDIGSQTAAEKKIVITFPRARGELPEDIQAVADKTKEYAREILDKTPLDCVVYVTSGDDYMGDIEVGQTGFACAETKVRVGEQEVEPWEKLFCDAVEAGQGEGEIPLTSTYTMRIDSG